MNSFSPTLIACNIYRWAPRPRCLEESGSKEEPCATSLGLKFRLSSIDWLDGEWESLHWPSIRELHCLKAGCLVLPEDDCWAPRMTNSSSRLASWFVGRDWLMLFVSKTILLSESTTVISMTFCDCRTLKISSPAWSLWMTLTKVIVYILMTKIWDLSQAQSTKPGKAFSPNL